MALISAASTSQRAAIIFYSACAGAAGLTEAAIWIYAVNARQRLVEGEWAGGEPEVPLSGQDSEDPPAG
jgi:hypothetical protein